MKVFAVLASVLAAAAAAPQLPAGLSAAICPNYPFCDVGGAAAIPGAALVAQQAQTLQYGDLEPLNVTPAWESFPESSVTPERRPVSSRPSRSSSLPRLAGQLAIKRSINKLQHLTGSQSHRKMVVGYVIASQKSPFRRAAIPKTAIFIQSLRTK